MERDLQENAIMLAEAESNHRRYEAQSTSLAEEIEKMLKKQRYMERELFKYEEKYKNIDLDDMHRKVGKLSAQLLME